MRRVSWVIVLFVLIAGVCPAFAQPRVTSIKPSTISLPAGGSLTVTLQGQELDKITSAQVALGTSLAPGLTVQLGPVAPTSRTVTITAGLTAAPRSDYQLHLRQAAPSLSPVATIPLQVTVAITLNSLLVNPVAVTGGQLVRVTLSLTGPAPAGGVLVTLRVDKATIRLPALSLQIVAGRTEVTFDLPTTPVGASTPTVLTAEYGRVAKTATVTVQPPAPASVAVSPQTVTGGTAVTGMVSLTGPAPAGGFVVPLASGAAAATVPQSTTVAAGQTTATFQIATTPVPKNTPVTISAGQSPATTTATLTVNAPAVVSVSGPATLTSFDFAFMTVTLDRPAPPNFQVMRSSSANVVSGWSGLSGTPDGLSTFGVPITGLSVSADTSVTLSATSGGVTRSTTLTVVPYTISALTLSPLSVIGGGAVVGTITLSAPNRNSNPIVSLSSDNPAAAVAKDVTLKLSETSRTFEILTEPVPSARTVTIRATMESKFGGSSRSATLTVTPAGISSLSLSPRQLELPAGNPVVQGTVTLNGQAPPGGVTLALSSDPLAATVSPSTLLIPAGQSSGQFTATVNQSATASSAIITAITQDGVGRNATIQLTRRPVPSVASLALGSQSALGGTPVTGTVTINQAFTSATPITFSAFPSAYPGGVATATFQPSSATVAAGQTTTTFTVTPAPVAQSTTLKITAFAGSQGRNASLTVNPATLTSLTLPVSTVQGGFPVTGTVAFNAIKGPGPVTLSSSNTSAATTGSLSGGDNVTTGTFTITTLPVESPTPVTISAAFRGTTLTAALTVVRPSILSAVTFPVQRTIGGVPVTATVALDGPAPDGGAIVSLGSTPTGLVPASVTIPASQSSANVQFTPSNPANPQKVSVLASYRGQNRTGSLTVEPLALSVPLPLSGQGGTQITVPVTIANNLTAPEGGLQLSLTSSNPAIATVPPTLTFPAGESSASVVIATQPVAANTKVSITLSRPGQGSTFDVTLTP